jgi:hypothetical protein
MSLRFNRKDSPQAREVKLNRLVEQTVNAPPFRYPIGAIYLTTTTDNPEVTLGYGTWELIGSGNLFT